MPSAREISASHRMMQVTEWELQRILLDIHDGPVQHMFAALSQLDLLRRALESDDCMSPQAEDRIGRIRQLLEGGLNEVRSFIGAFRPPEWEARGLVPLLEGLLLQHESMTDMQVALEVRGDRHFGLAGMRDRVQMVGGRFRLRSVVGRGTTIAAEVPG